MAKKICLVSAGLAGGGMERALTALANYFAQSGYEVTILNLFRTEVFFDLSPDIHIIWPKIDRKKHHRLVYAMLLIPYIRREIKRIAPITILSFGEWFNSYVILATLGMKQPLFISDRMGPTLKLGFPLDFANKKLYRFATGIIAQTEIAKQIIQQKTKSKNIIVIPNAVVAVNAKPDRDKKKQIVTVGRLSREKGHTILIRAFAKLQANEWTLHIIGDGLLKEQLVKETQILNCENRVLFHGHLKNFEDILSESEIFVLPSLYEGFPNALIESMSVPLACISSNCIAGPSEIIEHNVNGLLFPVGEVKELKNQLQFLIDNEQERERIAQNAFKVRETFAFTKLAQTYLDFILQKEMKK